ncbi:uncharacterized protein LOC131302313 [Rhododendron vialii]|uniref:uncharacterized protein LOC131302313 n=1 Tax=Rhododendron vialii TaxID=182163 RepID=UPI00265EF274|nr:uncharacterized protein LOC131302313 [Rhododendron vialii]
MQMETSFANFHTRKIQMENALETPPKAPTRSENNDFDSKTPTQNHRTDQKLQNSGNNSPIITGSAPYRLNVPKPFKYPERYTSPTDQMMSPISKGLLARSRKKPGMLLPPSKNQTKIQELTVQEVGLSQT